MTPPLDAEPLDAEPRLAREDDARLEADERALVERCAEDAAALAFASSRLRGDLEVLRAAVETGGGDPARVQEVASPPLRRPRRSPP